MRARIDGRRVRSAASRARILDAAEELYATVGFHATSLRAVAREVGMSPAGVARHYSSKDELLADVLAQVTGSEGDTGSPDLDPAERAVRLLTSGLGAPGRARLSTMLLGEATSPDHPAHSFVSARLDAVTRALTGAFGDRGVDLAAAWDGLRLMRLYVPDVDPESRFAAHLAGRPEPDGPVAPPDGVAARLAVPDVADVTPIGHDIADPPPEPTTREGQIMRAAAAAIAETGYRGMSVRELAAGLDTTHSALLYHFTSKVTLLEAVMDYRDQLVGSSWAEPVTPLDGIYNLYRRAVYNESHPDFIEIYSALSCEASDPSHPSHSYFRRRFEMLIGFLAMELSRLQVPGHVHAGLDPVAEAQWLGAMWDGLQLHGLYRDIPDTSDRVLRQLNTWTTLPLPRYEPAR